MSAWRGFFLAQRRALPGGARPLALGDRRGFLLLHLAPRGLCRMRGLREEEGDHKERSLDRSAHSAKCLTVC